ncbi:hypothetical protein PLICRDRAFT_43712 [Plicaturopsis crispa FD-325 SS-3]|nr:hypothetical protein PLICRDRAFT_43712 [Plicaturopsis crispa FD-325 SS-3]
MLAFFTFLALSGVAYGAGARPHGLTTDPKTFASESYDYVIIGGGNAGLVVAARLSENPKWNVGVIEAGLYHPDEPLINTPFLYGQAVDNTTFDWSLQTVPQANLSNRIIGTSIGKMLGGSSGLNFMTYGRASSPEYDAWATLGSPDWNWNNLLPYFKKSETVVPGESGVFPGTTGAPGTDSQYQGKSGPIKVGYNTDSTFLSGVLAPYVESFTNVSSFANPDPDSGNATGISQSPRSVDPATNQRTYSASAFFAPNQKRSNLLVLTGAQATKIVLANVSGSVKATGVKFSANGTAYSVNATKEVIVSTGAVKTPQLLELSGIGDSALLKSLNITTMVDLPGVGTNFQDHMLIGSDFLLKDPAPPTWDLVRNNASYNEMEIQEYAKNHDGIYASTNAAIAFTRLQDVANASEISEILNQLDKEISAPGVTPLQKAQYAIQRNLLTDEKVAQLETAMAPGGGKIITNIAPLANRSYIAIINIASRPYSRGTVHINTTDPLASPVIDPKYFSFSFDSKIMTLGMRQARQITQTEPLASLVERPSSPPANVTSDADYLGWLKQFTGSVYHPVGTAPLAPRNIGGVVDQNLRVYGTSNLRVVDGSVIPFLFAAHTQSTIYAVAERVSDMIKAGK